MNKRQNNSSAVKIFQVLDVLFLNFATGFTQTEIKEHTGLETTAVHRYVNTLVEVGYAEEIQGTKRYRPSHRLGQKSVQIINSLNQQERLARESLDRLTKG
jgi:DNA-binding IclR family transcriptional regulator